MREKKNSRKKNQTVIMMGAILCFAVSCAVLVLIPAFHLMYPAQKTAETLWSLAGTLPFLVAVGIGKFAGDKAEEAWLSPKFRENIEEYLKAWVLFGCLILLGAGITFLLIPESMGLAEKELFARFQAEGIPGDKLRIYMGIFLMVAFFIAPVARLIPAFLTEYVFRGFFLPRLCRQFGQLRGVVAGSFVWAIWWIPFSLISAYGGSTGGNLDGSLGGSLGGSLVGSLVIRIVVGFLCHFAEGIILSVITLRAGTIWPAVLCSSTIQYLTMLPEPDLYGLVGGLPMVLMAIYSLWSLGTTKQILDKEI